MGDERWFRGRHDGRERPFDWLTAARQHGIPDHLARVLYEQAVQQAHGAARGRVPELYLALLANARRDAAHPTPGKVTRVMRLQAQRAGTRRRPHISRLTGRPIAPGVHTLTSYLEPPGHARRAWEQEREPPASDAKWLDDMATAVPPDATSELARARGQQDQDQSDLAHAVPPRVTRLAGPAMPVPRAVSERELQARLAAAFGHLEELDALASERVDARLATDVEASQPGESHRRDATDREPPDWPLSSEWLTSSREIPADVWANIPADGSRGPARGVPLYQMATAARPALMTLARREVPNPADRDARTSARSAEEIARELSSDPGHPLDAASRARFERALSHDLSQVRVHDSDRAARAADELSAEAFTLGRDIYFGRGKFAPGSAAGDRLLAHELTHVVQHDQGRLPRPDNAAGISQPSSSAEQEARDSEDAILGRLNVRPRPAGTADAGIAPERDHAALAPAAATQAPGIFRQESHLAPLGHATDEEEDRREPTDEEIQRRIEEAQDLADARSTTDPEHDPEHGDQEDSQRVNADANADPDQHASTNASPAPSSRQPDGAPAGSAQLGSVPPGPDSVLPTFQALKGGPLARWDDEVAWHDYFQSGAGPAAGIQIDRGALIRDALSSGALAGFQAGIQTLAIDTLINVASTRIPYLQGFVEIARIAYDPAAWLEGQSQATVGKIANGLDQIWNGDIIDKIEGLVNVLDGLNGFIGLASTICWIVAAAGFVISFLCPAVLPFVALCANWAVTLGTISTLIGVYISLARVGVIGLRAAQMAWFESDPTRLLEQGERLRAQSQAFSQEFTVRAGHSVRQRAQTALQNRHAARTSPQPTQRTSTSSGTQPSRMQRIRSAMTGGGRFVGRTVADGLGGRDVRSGVSQIRDQGGHLRGMTQAYRGTGQYVAGRARTTRQTLADMEHAGAAVYHSDAQRRRVDGQLRDQGEGAPVNRERQALIAARDRRQAEHDEAVRRRDEAAARAQRARDDADEAQRNLERARAQHGDAVEAARTNLDAQRRLHAEAENDLRHQRGVRDRLQELERAAIAADDTQRAQICRRCIDDQEIRILEGEARVIRTQANVRIAEADLTIARNPIDVADARARGTRHAVPQAEDDARAAAAAVGPSNDRLNEAKVDANMHDLPGGQTRAQAAEAAERQRGYRPITDFTGRGRTDLHGHNKGAGYTGAGTSLVGEIFSGVARQEAMAASGGEVHGGLLGTWSRTGQVWNDPDEELDMIGTAGVRGEGDDYVGRLRARYEQLAAELPEPPRQAPGQLDGASQAFGDIDEEERQIRFQQEVITGLMQEGEQSMSALQAMQAISAANQQAVTAHQGELDTRLEAQHQLEQRGNEVQDNARDSQSRGEEGRGALGGFVNRFIQLMGMVPSRLVSNAGQGASGARQLDQGVRNQGQTAGETNTAGASTVQEAQRMRAQTSAAQNEAGQASQELQSLDQSIGDEQLATTDGMTFMQDAMTTSQDRLDAIAAEKERLRGEHAGAQSAMTGWIATHEQMRLAGLGELDGLVELIDQPDGQGQ